ncbi:MAG: hypothetical protein HYV60_02405, partial [Planctomycetia bacterium]|nr:hypothetical protein [Planctomycetia bacterium]
MSVFGPLNGSGSSPVEVVDASMGDGILVTPLTNMAQVTHTVIAHQEYAAGGTMGVNIGSFNSFVYRISTGTIAADTPVKFELSYSDDGVNFTPYQTHTLSDANANQQQAIDEVVNTNGTPHWQVTTTHLGPSPATYGVEIIAFDNVCGANALACVEFTDFDRDAFIQFTLGAGNAINIT